MGPLRAHAETPEDPPGGRGALGDVVSVLPSVFGVVGVPARGRKDRNYEEPAPVARQLQRRRSLERAPGKHAPGGGALVWSYHSTPSVHYISPTRTMLIRHIRLDSVPRTGG